MPMRQQHLDRAVFLQRDQSIWSREMLQNYPQSIADYNPEWVQYLNNLDEHQQWQFDAFRNIPQSAPRDLEQFLQTIARLQSVPVLQHPASQTSKRLGLTPKKAHEIEKILALLQLKRPSCLIDIGGGVGHLSAIVKYELGIETICLEGNADFVHSGEKYRRQLPGRAQITHIHAVVPEWSQLCDLQTQQELDHIWPTGATSLGLHTCGPLSLSHFALANRRRGPLINFACCYYRLHPQKHTNLSGVAPLNWTSHALTLATRGHYGFPLEHFSMKKRVKTFRYALELFLQRELGRPGFTAIGESKLKKYRMTFGQFAMEKLTQLMPQQHFNPEKLNQFFQQETLQAKLTTMFSTNLLRWCYGRMLEVHLLYDRVLYLEQQDMEVRWGTLFDEKISPRNIAICGDFKLK